MDDYEKEVKFKVFIDNPYNLLASYVAIMGLLLLYALWRRRDYYLSWMWETNEKYDKKMPRPEFRPTERVPPYVTYSFKMNPKLLGSLRDINFTKILKKCVEFFVLLILLVVCVFVYISLMILFSNLVLTKFHKLEVTVKEKKLRVDQSKYNYYCMDILGTLNGIFVLFAETLWVSLAKALTDLLNTRTQLDYERSHVFKLFGMSLIINFNLIFFYAFLKGAFYTFPHDRDRKNMYLGISDMNCGMGTCIDELYLIFLSTFKVKKIYQEVISLLKRRKLKTDVFPLDDGYVDVPCWEREYQLLPVTQHYIMDRLNKIFILLCQGTFFVCIFPLAPIIIFMFCVWEIRYWAKELIVHSRRPLIPQNWGLSMWKYVLLFMPFCAAFVNSLTWARHTHYLDRQMNDRYFRWVVERRFFADHYMGFFEFSDTKLVDNELDIGPGPNDTVPDFCMFPGMFPLPYNKG
ncbi:anoctamin-3-like [Pectinophora gossypiella]|uniref:anoctamin-3-like n=1 Tax=Pectinophora gossypiella TaxID=13191 RepID=UPI00214DFBE6|nr:anoctamin-3-like [Pectinophora gossypiella]